MQNRERSYPPTVSTKQLSIFDPSCTTMVPLCQPGLMLSYPSVPNCSLCHCHLTQIPSHQLIDQGVVAMNPSLRVYHRMAPLMAYHWAPCLRHSTEQRSTFVTCHDSIGCSGWRLFVAKQYGLTKERTTRWGSLKLHGVPFLISK